jgi:hypothetical protein
VTLGLSTAHAHGLLNVFRATDYTAVTPWVKLHTGDPGANGTANASAETTRKQLSFAAPSSGSMAASVVSWTAWSAGTETLTHFSIWDASSSGNFKQSGAFAASKTPTNGDTVNLTVTATMGTLAA